MDAITSTDRLLFTLILSVIIHIVIVLGISFNMPPPLTNKPHMSLDITLVKQQTKEKPEQADYLAQVNNAGGGETDTKTPEPSPSPRPVMTELPPASPQKVVQAEKPVNTTVPVPLPPQVGKENDDIVKPEPQKMVSQPKPTPKAEKAKPKTRPDKIIVQAKAKRKIERTPKKARQRQDETAPATPVQPTRRKLILPSTSEIANLEHHFNTLSSALNKRPKKRKISARTKEYAAAAYMKAWEMKVERIGNFNYPQEAKRKGINGSLMLSVDINPDGSVPPDGIVVSRSSGYKILDDAAVRIVQLGAPYAPIPKNVLKGNDMLTIIRTWKFESSKGLSTR